MRCIKKKKEEKPRIAEGKVSELRSVYIVYFHDTTRAIVTLWPQ